MTIAELLQLHPQHLEELRSFFAGWEFVDVEVAAQEKSNRQFQNDTFGFNFVENKLRFDGVFRGKNRTHVLFVNKETHADDTYYCFSYAQDGEFEDRIIFKIYLTEEAKIKGALET